ncbi:MAG: hypothetical protein ACOYIG_07900 [Acetivibrionales bacterium]|jgi:hypothetical protein
MAILKLKTNVGHREDNSVPQFSLSYKAEDNESNSINSYEILSALKENHDVVLEINTSLLFEPQRSLKFSPEEFLEKIRNLDLEYSCRKCPSQVKQDFFSSLFGGKKTVDCYEINVYVPDAVWKSQTIRDILPTGGVRYYIKNQPDAPRKVLDEMNRMTDKEKFNYFHYVIFDVVEYNQMGISSNHYGINDIKKVLGI